MTEQAVRSSVSHLRAQDATDPLSELALHLQNASRIRTGVGSSGLALRHLLFEPWVLDLLERLVKDELSVQPLDKGRATRQDGPLK